MPFDSFFDRPSNYDNKFEFYTQGGAPEILKNFIQTIEDNKEEIEEINLCWYLYNNKELHNYLKNLSTQGIKINIITIPLEGYDNKSPKKLKNLNNGQYQNSVFTKYDLAREIFGEYFKDSNHPNYNIYFFSHLYIRSKYVNQFSRGQLPYSLHIKSSYIKKKNGYLLFLSSSNLAVRDLVKHESMICIVDEDGYQETFAHFFADIISNSINVKDYNSAFDKSCNFYSAITPPISKKSFISSPFYFDSANILEEQLIKIIKTAQDRIIICAQHLAAFNYRFSAEYHSVRKKDETRPGVLGSIIKKAKEGIQITCLSQTFTPGQNNSNQFNNYQFRTPANSRSFVEFYNCIKDENNVDYFVNSDLHSKFIIVDSLLIFCTFNFTPTQFIYLDNVNITNFIHMPSVEYKGIHCEVSAYAIINDVEIVNSFVQNMEDIIDLPDTIRVK